MQDQRNTLQHNELSAIYCRISADKAGRSLGVERQMDACQELAERRGWTVAQTFTDNDLSAYSGKRRPGYEDLLQLMKSGEIRVVIALHTDRLHRSPTELESFITVCEMYNVRVETVQAGPVDLSTATGRMGARIYGAVARHEVEHAIERMQAAKRQAIQNGEYLGGQRPFGFEPRRAAVRDDEAEILRGMARAFIEHRSFWKVAVDLNAKNILTQNGKDWNALKVRNILIRPINIGMQRHKGVDEYPAQSPAIFSRELWADLMSAIDESKKVSTHPGNARKHLLKGFLYCGECGEKMFHKSKQQRDGSYKTTSACGKTDNQTGRMHGCGKVSRMVEPIIDLVVDCIMYRLDSPELVTALHRNKSSASSIKDLSRRQRELETRINEITDDYYVGRLLTRDQFERAKQQADIELSAVMKQLDAEFSHPLKDALGEGTDLRARWDGETLIWKRTLLALLIEKVIVHRLPRTDGYTYPKYKDKWRFDPELVEIKWRA